MIPDEFFMKRALQLARLGAGYVSPNPKVGCVIVQSDRIIGEGWHQCYGGPHAEVNAVNSVSPSDQLLGSTVYVTLEPCSHFGKTPPCADLLIHHQVKKVIIANTDPNPLVNGEGIKKLTNAGIEVVKGLLDKEGQEINYAYFSSVQRQRPYVILKWAQSADGFIAGLRSERQWISNVYTRQLVHRWRSEEDAVLVGSRTAQLDNPQLTVRDWSGRNPARIVIDRFLKLPDSLRLWKDSPLTLCYNTLQSKESGTVQFIRLDPENFINNLVFDLHQRRIQSVIVEGGATTLGLFLNARCWDEARVFHASPLLSEGIAAPQLSEPFTTTLRLQSDELFVHHAKN
jgi:diaminohydroxyphosphoribosylaminopyrimidine deaminase / 5-amino-6-(5-phosphoribosylamino)uracil reductase